MAWNFTSLLLSTPSTLLLLLIYVGYNIVHDHVKDRMSAFFGSLIIRLIASAEKLKQTARFHIDPNGKVHISHQYYLAVTLSHLYKDICNACNSLLFKIIMLKMPAIFYIFNSPSVVTAHARLQDALKVKSPALILLGYIKNYFKYIALEIGKSLYSSITGIAPPLVEFASCIIVNAFTLWRKVKKEAQRERSAFLSWWEDFISKMNINTHQKLLKNNVSISDLASEHEADTQQQKSFKDYIFRVRVITDTSEASPTFLLHLSNKSIQQDNDEKTSELSSDDLHNLDIDVIDLPPPPHVIISM